MLASPSSNCGRYHTDAIGIYARTFGDANGAYSNAGIDIDNSGDIDAA